MGNFSTPTIGPGNARLEVIRDHVHFGEGRAGERDQRKLLKFSQPIQNAEVFLSGFNMFYTREGHDHEVMAERVDVFVESIGSADPDNPNDIDRSYLTVLCKYVMADEDTGDSDDYNDCYIGFTVLAMTSA